MCVCVPVPESTYVYHMNTGVLGGQKSVSIPPGTGIADGGKLTWVLGTKSERVVYVLLSTESFVQPLNLPLAGI